MAEILIFAPRLRPAPPSTSDRRRKIEEAIQAALDTAHWLIAVLDGLDGDPDLEPDTDRESDPDFEPPGAALIGGMSQICWAGYDDACSASIGVGGVR